MSKSLSLFTQKLVWDWVSLLLASKMYGKWLQNCKNQAMLEKRRYPYFAVSGQKHRQQICKNTWNQVVLSLIDSWLSSTSKRSPLKAFSPVISLLLTLRTCSSVKNLKKKMPTTSLCWFAVRQQTSTLKHQKARSIYTRISVGLSDLSPSFQNLQEVA